MKPLAFATLVLKNPPYGRQRISRPIWMVAPIPKKSWSVWQNSPGKTHKKITLQFYTLYYYKISNLRPLLFNTFPQGFLISKIVWHPTLGSGGKKKFKQYTSKVNRRTDRRTNGWTRADSLKGDAMKVVVNLCARGVIMHPARPKAGHCPRQWTVRPGGGHSIFSCPEQL